MKRERFIPEGSQEVTAEGVTIYTYTDKSETPCAICYRGRRTRKSWHYRFHNEEQRQRQITEEIDAMAKEMAEKNKRAAERRQPHNLQIGDILFTCWGYDQTNAEFYKVISIPSKRYVIVQELVAPLVNGEEGFMQGRRSPTDEMTGPELRRLVDMSGNSPSISITSYQIARPWNGRPISVSWYS